MLSVAKGERNKPVLPGAFRRKVFIALRLLVHAPKLDTSWAATPERRHIEFTLIAG
jgi:hypothetical protein